VWVNDASSGKAELTKRNFVEVKLRNVSEDKQKAVCKITGKWTSREEGKEADLEAWEEKTSLMVLPEDPMVPNPRPTKTVLTIEPGATTTVQIPLSSITNQHANRLLRWEVKLFGNYGNARGEVIQKIEGPEVLASMRHTTYDPNQTTTGKVLVVTQNTCTDRVSFKPHILFVIIK
jgi:hypothetical protein